MPTGHSKVTIYDVAARAGVAISTVSRVLNDSPDVSDRTRARVMKAVEELRYRPDRTAKKLAQQRTLTLAIALPTFITPFHNELLKGVRMCLLDMEIDLLLCDLGWRAPFRTLQNFLRRGTVDGLLLAGVTTDERVAAELLSIRAPVVLIGSAWPGFDSFEWDDTAGVLDGVNHLVGQGHRRIGMIRSFTDSEIQVNRVAGYRSALEAAGIPFDERLVVSGDTTKHAGFSEEAGYEAMQRLLALEEEPVTAVFASSDVQALGAWAAIIDAGRRVPDHVAIVGYDDIKSSQFIGLSSVDQSIQQIGHTATERLLARLSGELPDPPTARRITPKLRVRRSSVHRINQES
jgi:LacI family transcriptional regulator